MWRVLLDLFNKPQTRKTLHRLIQLGLPAWPRCIAQVRNRRRAFALMNEPVEFHTTKKLCLHTGQPVDARRFAMPQAMMHSSQKTRQTVYLHICRNMLAHSQGLQYQYSFVESGTTQYRMRCRGSALLTRQRNVKMQLSLQSSSTRGRRSICCGLVSRTCLMEDVSARQQSHYRGILAPRKQEKKFCTQLAK